MTNQSELEQKIFSLTVETGRKFMKTRVLEDWTLSKQIMELVNAYITANYTPKLDPFDFVEPCEPDCTDVRHAYHEGQWDMAHRMVDRGLTKEKEKL